jgi:hypothetical protein
MDHQKDIESTLNALLLNASKLQEMGHDQISSVELSDEQKRLLDHLFHQWNGLSEEKRKEVLAIEVETKVLELAKKNEACLREVRSRLSHKKHFSNATQLDLDLN